MPFRVPLTHDEINFFVNLWDNVSTKFPPKKTKITDQDDDEHIGYEYKVQMGNGLSAKLEDVDETIRISFFHSEFIILIDWDWDYDGALRLKYSSCPVGTPNYTFVYWRDKPLTKDEVEEILITSIISTNV